MAPLHLAEIVGGGKPVAWALDGFPIYGYEEPDGRLAANLDWLSGHADREIGYHYHASKEYPYLNGGFKGVVELRDGEVAFQPRARGVRPFTRPLRGAVITGFEALAENRNRLEYQLAGETHAVEYSFDQKGAEFTFFEPDGSRRSEAYARPEGGRRGGQRPPRRKGPPQGEAHRPWLQVHAPEMDVNQDGNLSGEELAQEIAKTFAGYDRNGSGKIESEELRRPGVRSALGGFVREHRSEIDADGDSYLTRDELAAVVNRMFSRGDADGDETLSATELAAMGAGRRQ
jgi:hypothetical protein